jgi:protein-arginine deiminase
VDKQREILVRETGLREDEIIRVPFLHMPAGGGSLAYQPGTLNGIYLSDGVFAAPDPHGPVIDGKDIFKAQLESALAAHGISVKWVEDWDLYHTQSGEVHCGSNTLRSTPEAKWWESGR